MKRSAIPLDGTEIAWLQSRHIDENYYGFLAYPIFEFIGRKAGTNEYLLFVPEDGVFEGTKGRFDLRDADFRKIAARKYGMPEPSVDALLDKERNRAFLTAAINGLGQLRAVKWNHFARLLESFLGWTPTVSEPPEGHALDGSFSTNRRDRWYSEVLNDLVEHKPGPHGQIWTAKDPEAVTDRMIKLVRFHHDGKPLKVAELIRLAEFDVFTDGVCSFAITDGVVTRRGSPAVTIPEVISFRDGSFKLCLGAYVPWSRGSWKRELPLTLTHRIMTALVMARFGDWMGPEAEECMDTLFPGKRFHQNALCAYHPSALKHQNSAKAAKETALQFVINRAETMCAAPGEPNAPIAPVFYRANRVTFDNIQVNREPIDFLPVLEHRTEVFPRLLTGMEAFHSEVFERLYGWRHDTRTGLTTVENQAPMDSHFTCVPIGDHLTLLRHEDGALTVLVSAEITFTTPHARYLAEWLRPLLFNHFTSPIQVRFKHPSNPIHANYFNTVVTL